MEEVLLDFHDLLLLLEILLDVIDLESALKVVPLLIGLGRGRAYSLFQLEFLVQILEVLVQSRQEKGVQRVLDRGIHIVLTEKVVRVHIIQLEGQYLQVLSRCIVMLTAFYENFFYLLLKTLQVQGVNEVENVADLVCNLGIVKFREENLESLLVQAQTFNIYAIWITLFGSDILEYSFSNLGASRN